MAMIIELHALLPSLRLNLANRQCMRSVLRNRLELTNPSPRLNSGQYRAIYTAFALVLDAHSHPISSRCAIQPFHFDESLLPKQRAKNTLDNGTKRNLILSSLLYYPSPSFCCFSMAMNAFRNT